MFPISDRDDSSSRSRPGARLAFMLRSAPWRRVAFGAYIFGLGFAAALGMVCLVGRWSDQEALTSGFALLVALPAAAGICRWALTRFFWPLLLGVGATAAVTAFLALGAGE